MGELKGLMLKTSDLPKQVTMVLLNPSAGEPQLLTEINNIINEIQYNSRFDEPATIKAEIISRGGPEVRILLSCCEPVV